MFVTLPTIPTTITTHNFLKIRNREKDDFERNDPPVFHPVQTEDSGVIYIGPRGIQQSPWWEPRGWAAVHRVEEQLKSRSTAGLASQWDFNLESEHFKSSRKICIKSLYRPIVWRSNSFVGCNLKLSIIGLHWPLNLPKCTATHHVFFMKGSFL